MPPTTPLLKFPQTQLIGEHPFDPKQSIKFIKEARASLDQNDFSADALPESVISNAQLLSVTIPAYALSASNPCLFSLGSQIATVNKALSTELIKLLGVFCYFLHDKELQGTLDNGLPKAVPLLQLLVKEPTTELSKSSQTCGWSFLLFINLPDYSVTERLQSLFPAELSLPLSFLTSSDGADEDDGNEDITINAQSRKKKKKDKPPPPPRKVYLDDTAKDIKSYGLKMNTPIGTMSTVAQLARAVSLYTLQPNTSEITIKTLSSKNIVPGSSLDPLQFLAFRHGRIPGVYEPLQSEDILNPPESVAPMIAEIPFHLQQHYLDLLKEFRTEKALAMEDEEDFLREEAEEKEWTPSEQKIIDFFMGCLSEEYSHLLPESSGQTSWRYILQCLEPTVRESTEDRIYQFGKGHSNYYWRIRGAASVSFVGFFSLQLPLNINKPEVDADFLRNLRNYKEGTTEELQKFCLKWTTSTSSQDPTLLQTHIKRNVKIEATKRDTLLQKVREDASLAPEEKEQQQEQIYREFREYIQKNRWQSFEPRLNIFASANGECDPALQKCFAFIESQVDLMDGTAFKLWRNYSSDLTDTSLVIERMYSIFNLIGLNYNHDPAMTCFLGVLTNSYPEDKNPCNFVLAGPKSSGKNWMLEAVIQRLVPAGIFLKVDDESTKAAKGDNVNHNKCIILRDEAKTADLGIPDGTKGRIGGIQSRAEGLMKNRLSDGKTTWVQCHIDPDTNLPQQIQLTSKEVATNFFLTNADPAHFTDAILSRLVELNVPGHEIDRHMHKDRIAMNHEKVEQECQRIKLLVALTYVAGHLQTLGILEPVDDGWIKACFNTMCREMKARGFKNAMLPRNLTRLLRVHASFCLFAQVMWLFTSADSPLNTSPVPVKWSLTNFRHLQGRLHGIDLQSAFLVAGLFNDRYLRNQEREAVIRSSLSLCCGNPSVQQHSMQQNEAFATPLFSSSEGRVWDDDNDGLQMEDEPVLEQPVVARSPPRPRWEEPVKPPFLCFQPSESDPLRYGESFSLQKKAWLDKFQEQKLKISQQRLKEYRYLIQNRFVKSVRDTEYVLLMATCTTSDNYNILKTNLAQEVFRKEKKDKRLIRVGQAEHELYKLVEEPYPDQVIREAKQGRLEIESPRYENNKGMVMIPHPTIPGKTTCAALMLNAALTQISNVSLSVLYKIIPSMFRGTAFKFFTGSPCCFQCFTPEAFYHLNPQSKSSTLRPPEYYLERYLKSCHMWPMLSTNEFPVNAIAHSENTAKEYFSPCQKQATLQRQLDRITLRGGQKRTFSEI